MISVKFGEDLYLEFSPMVFSGNSNAVLRYNIKELGNQWKTSEAGTLLPLVKTEPGNYTIAIRIFNGQGKNVSDIWNLRLIVQPPFWKTLQFRIVLVLAILLTAFLIIRNYIRQRLERQKTEFERQQAVEKERARISGELHDDIGGGLTAIRLMSEMMIDKQVPGPQKITLEKISDSANDLIQKMNEIVWALNVNNDNLQSLIAYTRRYAVSYLDDLNLQYKLRMPDDIPDLTVTGKNRRSIFLIVKETLNNVAKHAGAGCVSISVSITDKLSIEVHDDGKGIDLNNLRSGGQGLANIRKRAAQLEGNIDIRNNKGTAIVLDIPLENLSA
jgi:signal transduction histidine kinase